MAVTNAELKRHIEELHAIVTPIPVAIARLETKQDAANEVSKGHHKTLYGNGKTGLVEEWTTWKGYAKGATMVMSVAITLLGVWQGLTACQASGNLATAIADGNTQAAITATQAASQTATATADPTPTDTATPTITLTPWVPTIVTPCGQAICVIEDSDEDILSRLCTVEVRGFGSKRRAACLSVISTVFKRIRTLEYSDGSVTGTILYGCTPERGCQHFPGFIINGCEGIVAEACPWNYSNDIAFFHAVARDALNGDWDAGSAVCLGYTYYGSHDIDNRVDACAIEADNGLKEWFYQ